MVSRSENKYLGFFTVLPLQLQVFPGDDQHRLLHMREEKLPLGSIPQIIGHVLMTHTHIMLVYGGVIELEICRLVEGVGQSLEAELYITTVLCTVVL